MDQLKKRWLISPRISPQADQALSRHSPLLRQILYNRGIASESEAQTFFAAELPNNDPNQLIGLGASLDRIQYAIQHKEKIVVYGDYDADGVSATALMVQTLQAVDAEVSAYIPNRFDEGYGLNNNALDLLKSEGASLIITVDCGIRSVDEANHAAKIGLDLIITDHHTPGKELPKVTALINPKQPNDTYPEKNLAGVGTAYKLATALLEISSPAILTPQHLLDLVAIGTVADLVPLVGENRALVRHGLNTMRRPHRQGLLSLLGVARINSQSINSSNIGFSIGPRINAAGRIASAMDAFQLLVTNDVNEAGQLAQKLDNRNRERQKITAEIQDKAEEISLADQEDNLLLYAADPDFNPGVVGLAASRLVDKFYRPAIVGEQGHEVTRASCRSIPEFHITHALDECADLLDHYGGHAAAAGFTVKNNNAAELIERLNALAKKSLGELDLQPSLQADAEVGLSDMKPELLTEIEKLQPTGYGNPEPMFVARQVKVTRSRPVGRENAHLKLTLTDGNITHDAIAFRQGHWVDNLPTEIDIIFKFELNEFNGNTSLQLNVSDIQTST